MNRPVSIVNFERCYLAGIVLGLIGTALSWNTVIAQSSANPGVAQLGPNFVPAMIGGFAVIGVGIQLLLWYFAARKGAVAAKWIITAFFAIGLLFRLISLAKGTFPLDAIGITAAIGTVLGAAAVWFLFRPDARPWFGEKPAV